MGDLKNKQSPTPKGLGAHWINPYRVQPILCGVVPGFSLRCNPWAEISERLRRISIKVETDED
jgi:hypothetical protein